MTLVYISKKIVSIEITLNRDTLQSVFIFQCYHNISAI